MELNAAVRLPLTLDSASVRRLRQDLDAALQSEEPVVTLVGHDEATFCAGMSLDAMIGGSGDVQYFIDLLATLHASPKPLLAVVNGAAIGGGLGLEGRVPRLNDVVTARRLVPLPHPPSVSADDGRVVGHGVLHVLRVPVLGVHRGFFLL